MKKSILILTLAIVFLATGCGSEDVKEPDGSQMVGYENDSNSEISELEDYIDSIKEQSDSIKASLEKEELTQTEMNIKAQELCELWDGALNDLWSKVESSLSEEEVSELLAQQRTWTEDKEKSAEEAGKEFEGGSLYSQVVNMEAAKITEERVYELYELLK